MSSGLTPYFAARPSTVSPGSTRWTTPLTGGISSVCPTVRRSALVSLLAQTTVLALRPKRSAIDQRVSPGRTV
jgi:hypothetical protein